jgi:hypothetical protein
MAAAVVKHAEVVWWVSKAAQGLPPAKGGSANPKSQVTSRMLKFVAK